MIQSEFFNTLRFARRLKAMKIDRKNDKLMRDIAFIGYYSGRKDKGNEEIRKLLSPKEYDSLVVEELRKHSACGAERNW